MKSKLVKSIREVIDLCGVSDGMTISFHHHLRNGDYTMNMVLNELANMNIKGLTVNASSVFDCHTALLDCIGNGTVSRLLTDYVSGSVGRQLSGGILNEPVEFRTHGGRARDIELGNTPIDVAFIAAPASDAMGNCTGKFGKSACGSLGYAFADARNAKKVVVITDELHPYPLIGWSIAEEYVDFVVVVDAIGDPKGIVSGTTSMTRSPTALLMAQLAVKVICASGLLKDGFSFQTGAGGASLAVAKYLKDVMLLRGIKGSFALGGITSYLVDMLNCGCFNALMDVQCFDLAAVQSIAANSRHLEVSARHYAAFTQRSAAVDSLDVAILGATQIDTNFNVNVHTDSNGRLMGGSGGHSDVAAGSKMAIVIAPTVRNRMPIITDRVNCISTPGCDIDVLVTLDGIAVNPKRTDILNRLVSAKLPVCDICELKDRAERLCGVPNKMQKSDRIIARVISRQGELLDEIGYVPMEDAQ